MSPGTFCNGMGDNVFDPSDTDVTTFAQILDFTSDSTHSSFSDLDGDGCSIAGGGPAGGQPTVTGTCIDFVSNKVTTVASGGFFSNGAAPYDGSFSTTLPNSIALTGAFAGDTCSSPPPINFSGTATRCFP